MRDDGVLYICDLENVAENGNMPNERLIINSKYWFENRYIGYGRSYAAQGVNERIDRLVRVEQSQLIHVGQYAVLGNGEQYRITLVSHGQDVNERTKMVDSKYYRQPTVVGLKYTELTLVKLENNYDIAID